MKLTNMRMEMVEGQNGVKVINDAYNASPTSMRAAIDLVSTLPSFTTKILVLGDMLELGEKEEEFHFEIGQSIDPQGVDYVFTFGNLGRFIAEGAKSVLSEERVFSFTDKDALIEKLKKHLDSETLVLVKASRGMRLEEVVTALT